MFEDDIEEYEVRSNKRAKYIKNKQKKSKELLDSISIDVYEKEFNNDYKAYLTHVFRFEDEPTPYKKPEPIVIVETHPFDKWI